jgi:hypothetical protein
MEASHGTSKICMIFMYQLKIKIKRRALPLTEHVQCARYSFKVVNLTDRKLENREAK